MSISEWIFWMIFIFLRYALPLILACLLFSRFFKRRNHFYLRIILSFIGYTIVSVFLNYIDILGYLTIGWFHFNFLIIFILAIGTMLICFSTPLSNLFFFTAAAYCLQHLGDDIASVIINISGMDTDLLNMFVYSLIQVIVLLLFNFIVLRNYKHEKSPIFSSWTALINFFGSLSCVYVVSMYRYGVESFTFTSYFYDFMVCIAMLSIQFSLFTYYTNLSNQKVLESIIAQGHFQEKASKTSIEIINTKVHDLKKQIRELSKINSETERKELLKELNDAVGIYDNTYHTGNETLDIVLTEKSLIAHQHNIRLVLLVKSELLSFMSNADIYSLFANALDNAIEYLSQVDEDKRIVEIKIGENNLFTYIKIENYCNDKLEFSKDGLPKTTKGDETYHGYGTQSIKFIAQKYHGECYFEKSEDLFTLTIMFNKPNNK